MLIYRYNSTTKELMSNRSTLKPEVPGENETDITPPVCTGTQIPLFIDGAWTVVSDYRKIVFYRKSDRQAIRLALGIDPDSTVTRLPPADSDQVWNEELGKWAYPLAIIKKKKTAELFRLCDEKLNEVLSYYPQSEPDTWPEKTKMSELWVSKTEEEKAAIVQDPTSARIYGMLFAEAVGTYVPALSDVAEITSLATRILGNKIGFGIYAGMIMKIKTDTLRLITLAATETEVDAINIDFSSVSLLTIRQVLGG